MKRLTAALALLCAATCAHATHNGTADGNSKPLGTANCNASFQSGCPESSNLLVTTSTTTSSTTSTTTSGGFAAPAGTLGTSPGEVFALAVALIAVGSWRRRGRQAGGDQTQSSPRDPLRNDGHTRA